MHQPRPFVRLLAVMAVCALAVPLAACGGGGGGGPAPTGSEGNTQPPIVDPTQLTQQLLETCGGETTIAEIQALVALYSGVLSGQNGNASFTLDTAGIQLAPGLVIPWQLDLGGDPGPEATGAFSFLDAGGAPVMPFAPGDLAALFTSGVGALPALLAGMPDGTQFVLTIFDRPGTPQLSGEMRSTFTSGQPSLASGQVDVAEGTCAAQTTWSNVPINSLGGQFPSAVFTTRVVEGADVLAGTLTTDGTSTAVAEVSLNGGATTLWEINLLTGAVTPQTP